MRARIRNLTIFAVLFTMLASAVSFIANVNENVAGMSEEVTRLARIGWAILIVASVVAWIRVFRLGKGPRPILLLSIGAGILCFVFYGGVGFASDAFIGVAKPTYVNNDVLELAIYGAMTTAFFTLFIASLTVAAYRIGSRHPKSPGPSDDQV